MLSRRFWISSSVVGFKEVNFHFLNASIYEKENVWTLSYIIHASKPDVNFLELFNLQQLCGTDKENSIDDFNIIWDKGICN